MLAELSSAGSRRAEAAEPMTLPLTSLAVAIALNIAATAHTAHTLRKLEKKTINALTPSESPLVRITTANPHIATLLGMLSRRLNLKCYTSGGEVFILY